MATATVFAAAIVETVAFYAVLFIRDLRHRSSTRRPSSRTLWTTLRNLLVEFGPAELLDTFAVRPLAMYAASPVVGQVVTGVILGKIAADAVFYTLAIIGYEVCKSATTPVTAKRAIAAAAVVDGSAWPAASERDGDPLAPSALDRLPHSTPYLPMDLDRYSEPIWLWPTRCESTRSTMRRNRHYLLLFFFSSSTATVLRLGPGYSVSTCLRGSCR